MADRTVIETYATSAVTERLIFNIGTTYTMCRTIVHIVATGFTGTVQPQVRAHPRNQDLTPPAFVESPYVAPYLNGGVGDLTVKSVDITDTSVIQIDTSGCDLALDITRAAGSLAIYINHLRG